MSDKIAQRHGMRWKELGAADQTEHSSRALSRGSLPLVPSDSEEEITATVIDLVASQARRQHRVTRRSNGTQKLPRD